MMYKLVVTDPLYFQQSTGRKRPPRISGVINAFTYTEARSALKRWLRKNTLKGVAVTKYDRSPRLYEYGLGIQTVR